MSKRRRANGDGTIFYDHARKKHIAKKTIGYKEDGSPKVIKKSFNTVTEASLWLNNIKYQINAGTFVDETTITIKHIGEELLNEKLSFNHVKESTYQRDCETFKRLAPIYNYPIQSMNYHTLKRFFAEEVKKYSQSIINKEFQMLKRIFNEAMKTHIIKDNPMVMFSMTPKSSIPTKVKRALTIQEQQKLLFAIENYDFKYSDQMYISMRTGMRMGEVNALTPRDVFFNKGKFSGIRVNKTISRDKVGHATISLRPKTEAGERVVKLTDDVAKILKDAITVSNVKPDELIFKTESGNPITTSAVNLEFQRICKKYDIIDCGEPGVVSLHSLRHTFATRGGEAKIPAVVLQKQLGHSDVSITLKTYTSVFQQYYDESMDLVNQYMADNGLIHGSQSEEMKEEILSKHSEDKAQIVS